VPPAGALFIEFIRRYPKGQKDQSELFLRFYLYNDRDYKKNLVSFQILKVSYEADMKKELYLASKFS
jgi:hypothetical protein